MPQFEEKGKIAPIDEQQIERAINHQQMDQMDMTQQLGNENENHQVEENQNEFEEGKVNFENVQVEAIQFPVINNIDFQIFEGMSNNPNFFYNQNKFYYNQAYQIMENIIKDIRSYKKDMYKRQLFYLKQKQGNIREKQEIQQFITNILSILIKSVYDIDSSMATEIDQLAEGAMFIVQTLKMSLIYVWEYESLQQIIENGLSYSANFYYRNVKFDIKSIYKLTRETLGEQNKPYTDKIDPHFYDRINQMYDIIKLQICQYNTERVILDIIKNSNNFVQIKDAIGIIKVFLGFDVLSKNYKEQIVYELIQYYKEFPFKMMQNTKQLPGNFIEKLLKQIKSTLNFLHYQEVERFINLLELEFHFVYFQSPQLQQKVAGIQNIIQKVGNIIDQESSISPTCVFHYTIPNPQENQAQIHFPIWNGDEEINAKKCILQWYSFKQIFEKIFNEASHVEIIKRSFPVIRFLYQNQSLSHDQIMFIYNLAAGKHHSLRSCVFSLLNNLVDILEICDLDFVFKEIQKTPFQDIDLEYINLVKAMLLNTKLSSIKHIPNNEPTNEITNQQTMTDYIDMSQEQIQAPPKEEEENINDVPPHLSKSQSNDTDKCVTSNEALVGDDYCYDLDLGVNNEEEVKKSIENTIYKNQNSFDNLIVNVCDKTQEKIFASNRRQYKPNTRGNRTRGGDDNEPRTFKSFDFLRGKYVTVVSPEGIKMYEYLWSIIQYGCTQYNSMSQELIDKAIEVIQYVVDHYYKPLKFDLLNKCVDMINKEEMLDQSLQLICSLNKCLPIEDLNDNKVFSTSEELFNYLESKHGFSNRVLLSISKYKGGFVKLYQLIEDQKKMNKNGISSPSSPFPNQMEEIQNNFQNEMNKKSPIKNGGVDQNNTALFRNEMVVSQTLQQQAQISQKLKQDILKIPNLNFKIFNAIDEQILQNESKVYKEYIETCNNRLTAILECLRGMQKSVSINLIKSLFEIFCTNQCIPQEKDMFYNLLIQLVVEQRQMNKIFQNLSQNDNNYNTQQNQCFELLCSDTFKFIFNEYFLHFEIPYFNAVVTNCFEAYFYYINEYIQNFIPLQGNSNQIANLFEPSKNCPSTQDTSQPANSITYVINTEQINGFERFWQLYLLHPDQAISNHAGAVISRIIILSSQHSEVSISEKVKQQNIDQIMIQLKDSYEALIANGAIQNFTNQNGVNVSNPQNRDGLFQNQYQDEISMLKQHYNQILQRSLEILNKLLLNIDKTHQQANNQREFFKVITIFIDNQVLKEKHEKQEKFAIQIRTNQTIREVFAIIGDRMNPKLNADQIEAYCSGNPIMDLNKLVSQYKIYDNNTFLVNKCNINIMNYDEINGNTAIPMGYEVLEDNSRTKGDVTEKLNQIKELLGSNQYEDGFIEFILRSKKESVEETISLLFEGGWELQDFEDKYSIEQSNQNSTQNNLNNMANQTMQGAVFDDEIIKTQYQQNNANQNEIVDEEHKMQEDQEGKDIKISFAKLISNNELYFDLLFQLLDIDNNQIQQKIWEIITILPVSKKSQNMINELCIPSDNPNENQSKWEKFLNLPNKYIVLYRLQMITKIISCRSELYTSGFSNQQLPNDPKEREIYILRRNFRQNFIRSDGFAFLYNAFLNVELKEFFKLQGPNQMESETSNNSLLNQNNVKSFYNIFQIVKTYVEAYILSSSPPESILRTLIFNNLNQSNQNNQNNNGNNSKGNNTRGNRIKNDSDNRMQPENSNEFIGPVYNPSQHLKDEDIARNQHGNESNKMEEMTSDNNNQNNNHNNNNQNNNNNNNSNNAREIIDLVQAIEQDDMLLYKLQQIIQLPNVTSKCLDIIESVSQLFQQCQDQTNEDMLIDSIMNIMITIFYDISNFQVIKNSHKIQNILIFQLFSCSSLKVRQKTQELIIGIITMIEQQSQVANDVVLAKQFFLETLLGQFQQFVNNINNSTCDEYIQTILSFISGNVSEEQMTQNFNINITNLFQVIIQSIQNRPIIETRYSNNQDRVLTSLLKFTQELILKKYELANFDIQFIQDMINYLFYIPGVDMDVQNFVDLPKCKHRETRQAALRLILTLCSYSPNNFQMVFKTIQQNQQHLQINEQDEEVNLKPAHGFVGLKNLGCTCYINSLIQQFFMIKDFRKAVLNAQIVYNQQQLTLQSAAAPAPAQNDNNKQENKNEMEIDEVKQPVQKNTTLDVNSDQIQQISKEHTLNQLQLLFAQMESTIKQYVWPTNLIESIKGFDGEQINVRVQQDVNEFFNRITDKIEDELKPTDQKNLLQELIGGNLSNEIISLEEEYPFLAETIEPYLTITVDIQKCKNLYEALDTQIKGDTLDGDNMYYCEKYQKKIRAQKRSCIKTLPNNLVLTLKRFEFDYNTMEKKKINDYFEFPLELNLRNWTKQKLFQQEGRSLSDSDIHSDEYYQFKLAGVLVHNGTADGGHYYSFIKNREDSKWYEFNDSYVKEFNIDNLADECYGGKQQNVYRSQMWDEYDYNKSRNAYILFYERVQPYPHSFQQFVNQPIQNDLAQKMKDENREFWKSRFIFDSDYFNFVREFIFSYQFQGQAYVNSNISYSSSQINQIKWMKEFSYQIAMTESDQDYGEIDENQFARQQIEEVPPEETLEQISQCQDIQTLQFALNNLIENQLRSRDHQSFCQALKQIQTVLLKNISACFWFLEMYLPTKRHLIISLLLDQSDYEIRDRFQEILIICLENIYSIENTYLLKTQNFKRVVDQNNNYHDIQNYTEPISCLYRFLVNVFFQLSESFYQNFSKASNFLVILKYLVVKCNSFIQIMNDQFITKNYMMFLNNLLKKQLNSNNVYVDQNIQNNIRSLLDILTSITTRCVTRGMHMIQKATPVYYKSDPSQLEIYLEPEIENSILQNIKEYQQICQYVSDPYSIFIHIAWGNESVSKKLVASLKEFIIDSSYSYYSAVRFDVIFKIAKEQIEMQDGFSEMRIRQLFFSGYHSERTFFRMEMRSKCNESLVMEFLKWVCDYSQQNQLFHQILSSSDYDHELRWVKPFLIDQTEDKIYRHMSQYQLQQAKDLLMNYMNLFEKEAVKEDINQQNVVQDNNENDNNNNENNNNDNNNNNNNQNNNNNVQDNFDSDMTLQDIENLNKQNQQEQSNINDQDQQIDY